MQWRKQKKMKCTSKVLNNDRRWELGCQRHLGKDRHLLATRFRSRPSSSMSIASVEGNKLIFWFCGCCCWPRPFLIFRRPELEWLVGATGAPPREGACGITPGVLGGTVASSIIIIACRRLLPTAGTAGISGKEERVFKGVNDSGTRSKTEVEGIVEKWVWDAGDSIFAALRGLLRWSGLWVFDGARGGDGTVVSGGWFDEGGALGVVRLAEGGG